LYKSPKTLLKIAFIFGCSIAISACTSSNAKKLDVKETAQAEQTTSPTSSSSPTLTPTPTPIISKIAMENEAFRIFEPAPNTEIGTTFKVKGQARVFEGAFSYTFEDGHNVLAEGNVHAAAGAPEWADFEFTVTYEKATNPIGVLILFEKSAKDGSSTNQLIIPLKFKADIIQTLP
jgi:hypothetical protein